KTRFQASFFQSYLKKGIPAGKQAAQIWRRLDEMPKCLLPSSNKAGTMSPISGPATYQGQGRINASIIWFSYSMYMQLRRLLFYPAATGVLFALIFILLFLHPFVHAAGIVDHIIKPCHC